MRAARSLARTRSISLGAALSELARRGLQQERNVAGSGGFPLFHVSPGARAITLEDVKRMEDEA